MKRTRLIPTLLLPLLLLTACGQESSDFDPADYEHPAYVSAIEQADCCLCGDRTDHILSDYWGQDNRILNVLGRMPKCPMRYAVKPSGTKP